MEKIIEELIKEGTVTIDNNDLPYILMKIKYYCKKQNIMSREFITTQTVPAGDYYMGCVAPIEFTFAVQGLTINNIPYTLTPTEDNKTQISELRELGYKY